MLQFSHRAIRKSLTEKVTFEQSLGRSEGESHEAGVGLGVRRPVWLKRGEWWGEDGSG